MTFEGARSLFEAFARTAARVAGRPALTFLDADLRPTTYTFDALHARAARIAEGFAPLRLPRGATVGILLERQEEQVLHYLAALSRGLTPAILTPWHRKLHREHYARTLRAVLGYCRFSLVVADPRLVGPGVRVVRPFSLDEAQPAADGALPQPAAAFLQFSSGTTGIKRGVAVSHDAALHQLSAYARAIGLRADDVIVGWLPLYHDMGFITGVNLPLAAGVHSVMMHPLDWVADPGMYLRAAHRYGGTLGWHPNFAYALMAERARDDELAELDLSRLRGLVNCSEPVTWESQERFRRRFAPRGLRADVFWGCYAMAETTFAVTHGSSADPAYLDHVGPGDPVARRDGQPFVSVGRPLDGVRLCVMDDAGRPCADRRLGELWVQAPFTAAGYHNDPDATAAAFRDGWYRTGDLGYRVGGEYFVCGRKKDLLIIGGVNVHPQDVEDAVAGTPGVHAGRVAVFGCFDERTQTERGVVLVESDLPGAAQGAMLIEARQRAVAALGSAHLEVHVVPSGWLVKSSAGKMARAANREKWQRWRAPVEQGAPRAATP